MANNTYNFIDLFCGCGGFSKGLEMAGHKCLLGVDFQKEAIDTFVQNHKDAHGICMDIHKLNKKKLSSLVDINKIDMVVGGPPCQGFSTVGRGQADDLRNSLFQEFVRVVRLVNPKIVIFENVTGILAEKNSKTLQKIFDSFEKIGFQMDAQVMSADLYGVPSKRRRAIIMGVKGGVPVYPNPISKSSIKSVKQAFSKLETRSGKILNHDLESAKVSNKMDQKRLKKIPPGAGIRYERDEKKYLPKSLRYDVEWSKINERRFRQARLQRLPWDKPAPTILTSRTTYYHPEEQRHLTVREAAKLQSFPNNFEFKGSLTAQFRQIGNAVPPILARKIGSEIKKINFNVRKMKKFSMDKREQMLKQAFGYRDKYNRIS